MIKNQNKYIMNKSFTLTDKAKGLYQCNHCQKIFVSKNGPTNCMKHAQAVHPSEYASAVTGFNAENAAASTGILNYVVIHEPSTNVFRWLEYAIMLNQP